MKKEQRDAIPVIEGIWIGILAGVITLIYRICLEYADTIRSTITKLAKESVYTMILWVAFVAVLGIIVYKLVKYEPLISGSGIPQLEGEVEEKIHSSWKKVLPAKFMGGVLSLFAGLALGREGPSIQLGAMAGQMSARGFKLDNEKTKFYLICGASAGLSAAFNAPLAGVLFALEEVHKKFSPHVLIGTMCSSLTADVMVRATLGSNSVFRIKLNQILPIKMYGYIIILGIVLGLFGALYNWFTLKMQDMYKHLRMPDQFKMAIPFVIAGILAFAYPLLLGSGHNLIGLITGGKLVLSTVLVILVGRFIFSGLSFGSGAPGGIFFPLLVIGGYIGGAFALIMSSTIGLDLVYLNNFVLLAMAGYFAAIVRAPLTGIILVFELTGNLSQMLSLSTVSIVAYVVAALVGSKPIYESLLERLVKK
ncbi:MAG: ClC family H(+)/Cl(-) exchange transporter [Suipraeoptans sp.]